MALNIAASLGYWPSTEGFPANIVLQIKSEAVVALCRGHTRDHTQRRCAKMSHPHTCHMFIYLKWMQVRPMARTTFPALQERAAGG